MRDISRLIRSGRRSAMIATLVVMFFIAVFSPRIFITVPAGQAGVLWLRFFGGTDVDGPTLGEGLHVIFPWDRIYLYVTRIQAKQEAFEVISQDGLHFELSVNTRWRLISRNLGTLHRDFGMNYADVLLMPEVNSVTRTVIARYPVESVYSNDRRSIEDQIYHTIAARERTNRIAPADVRSDDLVDNLSLVDVLITKITLPPKIQTAIANKFEQLIVSEEYAYRLSSERQEAERKGIEAQGIQNFQNTVQAGISEPYLKWRGIEATLKLATSANAKVVVIGGGGSQGLPLILNTGDAAAPAPAEAAPTSVVQKAATPAPETVPTAAGSGPLGGRDATLQGQQTAARPPQPDRPDGPAAPSGPSRLFDYWLSPAFRPPATPSPEVVPPSRAP